MKACITYLLQLLLSLRYRIIYKGLENLDIDAKKGILFLPNHPAVVVDPLIVSAPLFRKYSVRPLIIEYMYYIPILHRIFRFIGALSMPNLAQGVNSIKRKKMEKLLEKISEELNKNNSFLIYPSGTSKRTGKEQIGGAFGVAELIQENPECCIVLIRIDGLWGSSFSRAQSQGLPVDHKKAIQNGLWTLLKNAFFFAPRRNIVVTYEVQDKKKFCDKSKDAINEALETWYNRPYDEKGEPLSLVPYSFYNTKDIPEIKKIEEQEIDIKEIPGNVKKKVDKKLADLANLADGSQDDIKPESLLFEQLGLDSLDIAEFSSFLENEFDVNDFEPEDLTTVGRAYEIAAGVYKKEKPKQDPKQLARWKKNRRRKKVVLHKKSHIVDSFFASCDAHLFTPMTVDPQLGIYTGYRFKKSLLLLIKIIQKFPGKRIGILLPASNLAYTLIIACQYANKIPVMINWTVGKKHIESMVKVSKLKKVISSWAFLDSLQNVDLSAIDPYLTTLEEEKVSLSLLDCSVVFLKALMPHFFYAKAKITPDDEAVLLFTSGTEGAPKAVPLTHKNIMENIEATLDEIPLYQSDALLAFLPPFHSFGFTITGILPLLTGVKTAFYPNPTDTHNLKSAIGDWNITIFCSAPTFLENIFESSAVYKKVRLVIAGAEKTSKELRKKIEEKTPKATFCEGYGITECSPVLTINKTGNKKNGVGKPLSNLSIKIVDPENAEKEKETNEIGEILASGPTIFSGYLNRGISNPFVTLNGQKWYKTGDLGKMTEENMLIISGRLKRFIKVGGEMVSISSLEDTIQEAFGKGRDEIEFCLSDESEDDEKQKLTLFTIHSLKKEHVNKKLESKGANKLAKIEKVIQVDTIPVTSAGKVSFTKLREKT